MARLLLSDVPPPQLRLSFVIYDPYLHGDQSVVSGHEAWELNPSALAVTAIRAGSLHTHTQMLYKSKTRRVRMARVAGMICLHHICADSPARGRTESSGVKAQNQYR